MRFIPLSLAALALVLPSTASALSYTQTQELTAGDSTSTAMWGNAVYAHDGVLAVTDTFENAIYVYERQGVQWARTGKLVPPADDATTLELSAAVAVTATNVFTKHCTTGDYSLGRRCHVDVFAKSGSTWAWQERVAGDTNAYEKFGMALAADGDVLVAGASLDQAGGIGSAYVFVKTNGSYARVQKLVPDNVGRSLDAYGQTVALSGTTILVGSLAESDPSGSEGAIYQYSSAGNPWSLDARLVVPAGDGLTMCFAGDVIAASGGLGANIDIIGQSPLTSTATHNTVRCDATRIGATTAQGTNLQLFSPTGTSWSEDDLPLGGVPRGIAMSDGAIFAGIADTPPKVRILTYGKLAGETCTESSTCAAGFCVDGVCCESACGGGSTTDCQACSRAAGSATDGKCLPVATTYVCRAANGVCDVADHCDGTGLMCPADLVAPNGSACSVAGTCHAGACETMSAQDPPVENTPVVADASDPSSGGCSTSGSSGSAWPLVAAVAFVVSRLRSRRVQARARRPQA